MLYKTKKALNKKETISVSDALYINTLKICMDVNIKKHINGTIFNVCLLITNSFKIIIAKKNGVILKLAAESFKILANGKQKAKT